jgi:hypothetical protein
MNYLFDILLQLQPIKIQSVKHGRRKLQSYFN